MAIFKYTLPSGSEFPLDAPNGTTPAQADKIFYEQVAAGAFVGYRVGDSLTNPVSALTNFGLTRLERGTAGVDDTTLLAVIQNLPIVAPVPALTSVPVANPVSQADYITTKSGLGPSTIGSLSQPQVQTLLAQVAASVDQDADLLTQEKGLGRFGLNALQLERAGYLKPGTVDRYLGGPQENTFSNPDNFVVTLQSPSVWSGKDGVTSVTLLQTDVDKQNQIQQQLMQQSYESLVANGTIKPAVTSATQPTTQTGQVYSTSQTLVATTALTVIAAGLGYNGTNTLFSDFANLFKSSPADLASQIPGGDVTSLASGAIASTGAAFASVGQVTDVNSAITAAGKVTSAVNQDIGALVTTASKIGTAATTAWAKGQDVLNDPGKYADKLLAGAEDKAKALVANVEGQAKAAIAGAKAQAEAIVAQGKQAIDNIAKAAKNAVAFADTKLTSLVAGVKKAAAFANTVDRSTVDTAVTRVIGSEKIPSPTYELPNKLAEGIKQDLAKAQEVLKTAQQTGQAIVNQGQAIIAQGQAAVAQGQALANQVQGQAQSIAGQATGQFNNLRSGARRLTG
jgi:hypothetical protein